MIIKVQLNNKEHVAVLFNTTSLEDILRYQESLIDVLEAVDSDNIDTYTLKNYTLLLAHFALTYANIEYINGSEVLTLKTATNHEN